MGSQQCQDCLQLTNPFLPLPMSWCGHQDLLAGLCLGGGSGSPSLCALWLFPKVIPLTTAES